MFDIRSVAFAVIAFVVLVMPASALTLDFDSGTPQWDGGNPGSNLLTGYVQGPYNFEITFTNDFDTSGPNLFDSSSCTIGSSTVAACGGNDDGDLVPDPNPDVNGVGGNILIRQEANQTLDDDATGSGSITFELLSGPAFSITGFSAIDEGTFSIIVGATTYGSINSLANGQTGTTTFTATPLINVGESFTVSYVGSGGVDSIVLAPVPLPAAGFLLVGGLGALALLRRRRPA